MAFALLTGKTKTVVDYSFKDYDVLKKWKLYPAWKLLQTCNYFNSLATQQLAKTGCAKIGGSSDGDVSSISSGSSNRPMGQKMAKKQRLLGQRQKIQDAERKEERCERRKRHDEVFSQMTTYGAILKDGQKTLESVVKALTPDNIASLERMLKCKENPKS